MRMNDSTASSVSKVNTLSKDEVIIYSLCQKQFKHYSELFLTQGIFTLFNRFVK